MRNARIQDESKNEESPLTWIIRGPSMTALRRASTIGVLAAVAVAASGCAGGNGASDAASSGSAYGVFTGNVTLTGEVSVKGSFTDTITARHETCNTYARGIDPATTLWVVPTPNNAATVSGHAVAFTAGVPSAKPSSGYHGPGKYTGDSALVSELTADNASFLPGTSATTVITVSDQGWGSMSFTGMLDTFNSAEESGSVTWRCTG